LNGKILAQMMLIEKSLTQQRKIIMGIFTRFKDIISSNLNSMLDKAEDPEKLIKLMIQEMEDTLVEIKASCAGVMANKSGVARTLQTAQARASDWESKAALAVSKGRDDLALEALSEKRRYLDEVTRIEAEDSKLDDIITQYKEDIEQLESKLAAARDKHKSLIHRHTQAQKRQRVENSIRRVSNTDAFARFEAFENRIDRMEAGADLINTKAKPSLEDEFDKLTSDDALEGELAALKQSLTKTPGK
jgi:phage shock protein A